MRIQNHKHVSENTWDSSNKLRGVAPPTLIDGILLIIGGQVGAMETDDSCLSLRKFPL